ncbi:uncharacterized protein DUF4189 [Paraburkholderia unamae]|uniref:DUF4189 domain-containing protein n=1 Tax=Paraburkholderia unamae TaxID=219649 RepID=UPI000DC4C016|nr:DUF4189 domain-containing protein [Paraburkholderia unamae]RAR59205.1 uncharacterized protein DUF4189 [Paraburkholderia unamae]
MESCRFLKRAFLLILSAVLVSACGSGGGGDAASTGPTGPSFINWSGSSNGSVVLAANNVQVQFLTDGDLYYNNTEYSNVKLASTSSATVDLNGTPFATVTNAAGSNGSTIAVLYCLGTTTLAQIVPTGTTIAIDCSGASTTGSGTTSTTGTGSSGSNGGATGTSNLYGAVAASGNQTRLLSEGIAHDYPSQSAADSAAVSACASNGVAGCGTVVVFGTGQCGALAVGSNLAWGAASGNSMTNAESTAINECTSAGGQGCSIQLSACN